MLKVAMMARVINSKEGVDGGRGHAGGGPNHRASLRGQLT